MRQDRKAPAGLATLAWAAYFCASVHAQDGGPAWPSPQAQGPAPAGGRPARLPIGDLKNPFQEAPAARRGVVGWISQRPSPQVPAGPAGLAGQGLTGQPPAAGPYSTSPIPGELPPQGVAPGMADAGAAAPPAAPQPGSPTPAPGPAPNAAAEAFASAAGMAGPGFGGGSEAAASSFPMFGDRGPLFARQAARFPGIPTPLPPGVPRAGAGPGFLAGRSVAAIVPAVRAFKIADNQYPRPVDRVWVNFNYFDGVNSGLNSILQAPIKNMQVYNETFGFEKTFLDQQASIGFRLPVNTLTIQSGLQNLHGAHTSVGDLSSFVKYAFYADDRGNLLSGGLDLSFPTGPRAFAGYPSLEGINAFEIQPFLGYIYTMDRAYVQGFTSIAVPAHQKLATMYYFDISIGYFLYRSRDPRALISAIVPAFETHLNQPLNWAGFQPQYVGSTPTVVDLTFGLNVGIANRATISTGYVRPVTGPTPFDGEFALMLNIPFGARGRTLPITPPVF
ncbi:hypothetical protein [Aquisphaera insulae]|uniref:hypothetical protein n=1 Tax=Aquisphaera insulae TaxID=2712864 RepID=UPI0013ECC6E1|nr:hypothetical protein [Aquisphaera insulae]